MLTIMQTEFRLWLPEILIMLEARYRKKYSTDRRPIKDNQMLTLNVIFPITLIIQSLSHVLKYKSLPDEKQ